MERLRLLIFNLKLRRAEKRPGQSMVEFALLLPLLLMMLSGLVEFGFAINSYLDLVDTAREVARFSSDDDPIHLPDGSLTDYNQVFYLRAANMTTYTLGQAGQITLDPNEDDLVVSVFQVRDQNVISRFPNTLTDTRTTGNCLGATQGGEMGWRMYCNDPSALTQVEVERRVDRLPTVPPNTGVVLVEIFYDYNMVLALPWITAFVPDPIPLHAYTFAPNAASEPAP
ncbi:MAG: pilus assembly protein [Anaerolineales bacterium]|nr:pilus assembly protein [Anaerolineales bacterium]